MAERLIGTFGSLAGVLSADRRALASAAAHPAAASQIRLVGEAMRHTLRQRIEARPLIGNRAALIDYLSSGMAAARVEQVRALFLDARHHLIADELMASGCVTEAPVYGREILKRALDVGATGLILVHNHPSGDPEPSESDIAVTRSIALAGRALDVQLHDHIIVAREGWVSLRDEGLF